MDSEKNIFIPGRFNAYTTGKARNVLRKMENDWEMFYVNLEINALNVQNI